MAERLELEKRALTDTPIHTREEIAHFLMRLLFCLFADNIGLLPKHVFRNLIQSDDRFSARIFKRKLTGLFQAMSEPDSSYGEHTIKYFNGGLFDSGTVLDLDLRDLSILHEAATRYNWSHVAPAIFGTLFERSLKAERRSLIGAHYTSEADIELIVEPVVMKPMRDRWAAVRDSVLLSLESSRKSSASSLLTSDPHAETLLAAWFDELAAVRILDPACGSGNFLYVALRKLLDLWLEARDFAVHHNIQLAITYAVEKMVSPQQLFGIETEFYAHELASVVVWIGFLQWKHEHGILEDKEPILQKLPNIEHDDAILRYDPQGKPYEPTWPEANFIIGNPPFLGDKKMRRELDTLEHPHYTDDLRLLYKERVPGGADLVTYWFEKARRMIEDVDAKRAGLLATQSIRAGKNRAVLERILESGNIFFAHADRPWLLDGASVRIAIVGFDSGTDLSHELNGIDVPQIHADLSSASELTRAVPLDENRSLAYVGTQKGGNFDLSEADALRMLRAPLNPNSRSNAEVVKPWANGRDVTHRPSSRFIIDFHGLNEATAAFFELPFQHVTERVRPKRTDLRRAGHARLWWLFAETRPGLRKVIGKQKTIRRYCEGCQAPYVRLAQLPNNTRLPRGGDRPRR